MAQSADEVLFFIPDISGFTKFVTSTEIEHSQALIQMLLEGLVDANQLGLKVSEFEGDAVLFYRAGSPPDAKAFVEQARKMFTGFHANLRKFEASRQCDCGACAGANNTCGGKNGCKGEGVVKSTAKECETKGGKVVPAPHPAK